MCDLYYYGVTEGSKQNAYTVFSSQSTHTLMAFVFKGYDNVFGSHYDEYAFEYDKIETNFDSSVFDIYQSEWHLFLYCVHYVSIMCVEYCTCYRNEGNWHLYDYIITRVYNV